MRPLLSAVLLAAALSAGAAPAAEAERLFAAGNEHYAAGRFEEAAGHYAQLVNQGFDSPVVRYNLGNAHFKLGRIGAAILEYEKAARMDPADPDVQANLEFVRSLTADKPPEASARTTGFFVERLLALTTPEQDALLFIGVYLLAGAAGAAAILARSRRVRAGAVLAGALMLPPMAAAGGALAWKTWRAGRVVEAVVLRERVDVLSGPGEENTTLFTVHEGLKVIVRGTQGSWSEVRLDNGLSGWVPGETLGAI
ncbi:MAG TPA: tetratricopeptide repeat protein [Candidatus Polarisedimenticolia bacterium]|nr:tetratricopeptide repeat protein [Candidatus Polarisedimenticolia bacterium]